MKNIFRSLFFALLIGVAVVGMYGCPQNDANDGPAEQAGEKIDNAVDNAGDAIEDAGDKAGDAIEDAGDKAHDAVN
jgi:uncharacterized protein YjbJ (UPF0337 family)